jgi:hypothetical protein
MSQRRLYYSYIGGKVFGNDGVAATPGSSNRISPVVNPDVGDIALNP